MNQSAPRSVRKVMPDPSAPTPPPSASTLLPHALPPSRRTVLRAVAVTGAGAAVLAACGGGDDTVDTGSGGGGTGGASASSPADDSPSATDSADGGGGGGGGLVATADVPVGGGVVLEGKKIVVTQPRAGEFKAFTAVCTHQSCTVASVKDNTIACPCHGSTFSAADGSVKGGPASAPLRSISVAVEGDEVVES